MVLALLAGLAFTVWSGMETYAAEDGLGPLAATQAAPAASAASIGANEATKAGLLILASNGDSKDRAGRPDSIWKDIHEIVANFVFLLVLLHLGGVLIASLAHRENLVRAMITGDKRAE
ncbi:MAG: cytochrome b/b6 domain-containing protein, partial [Proteobacteria bacterium]|nr:cytochrome b/b6 domain-containing protein [Pseudomonadota bacterium]